MGLNRKHSGLGNQVILDDGTVVVTYDSDGVTQETGGLTISSGDVTLTSGDLNLTSGDVDITSGDFKIGGNAALQTTTLWEWNATDLTQFDTQVDQVDVSASAVAVVDLHGRNVLEFTTSTDASVTNDYTTATILPIDYTPADANYGVSFDCSIPTAVSSIVGAIAGVRYVDADNFYYVYTERLSQNNFRIAHVKSDSRTLLNHAPAHGMNAVNQAMGVYIYADGSTPALYAGAGSPRKEIAEFDSTSPITSVGKPFIGWTSGGFGSITDFVCNIWNVKVFKLNV